MKHNIDKPPKNVPPKNDPITTTLSNDLKLFGKLGLWSKMELHRSWCWLEDNTLPIETESLWLNNKKQLN